MFSVYPFPLWWLGEYILCLIIIIKLEVLTSIHCIGSGNETVVCAVCLSIFLFFCLGDLSLQFLQHIMFRDPLSFMEIYDDIWQSAKSILLRVCIRRNLFFLLFFHGIHGVMFSDGHKSCVYWETKMPLPSPKYKSLVIWFSYSISMLRNYINILYVCLK